MQAPATGRVSFVPGMVRRCHMVGSAAAMDRRPGPCHVSWQATRARHDQILCIGIAVVDFVFRYREPSATPGKHIAQDMHPVVGGMANAAVAATGASAPTRH